MNTKLFWLSYTITKLPEGISHEGRRISGSFYNKLLYQILLTHLLSLALLAELLDYRICTLGVPHTAWLVDPHNCHRRQLVDSAKMLHWVWLTRLNTSRLSTPSTSSARICWATATPVSLHQLSKDLRSCCYYDSARMLSLTPPPICTQQGDSV